MAQQFTEASVQPALLKWLADYRCRVPNFHWAYESDVLALDFKDRWTDFEIKCSRTDFFKDFAKGEQNREHRERMERLHKVKGVPNKHEIYSGAVPYDKWFPNYLVYVLPQGMISHADVPKYAGIVEYDIHMRFQIARRKKRLNEQEMPYSMLQRVAVSMSYRMLDARQAAERHRAEADRLKKKFSLS